jgi:hypothetical protein
MTEQKQQSQQQQKDESGKINCAIHSAAAGQWYQNVWATEVYRKAGLSVGRILREAEGPREIPLKNRGTQCQTMTKAEKVRRRSGNKRATHLASRLLRSAFTLFSSSLARSRVSALWASASFSLSSVSTGSQS